MRPLEIVDKYIYFVLLCLFAFCIHLASNVWFQHQSLSDLKYRIDMLPEVENSLVQLAEASFEFEESAIKYKFEQNDDTKFVNQVYTVVRKVADLQNVRVASAAPGKIRSVDDRRIGEIRVSVQGRFSDLMNFIEELRLSEPALYVVEFNLLLPRNSVSTQNSSVSRTLSASITLQGARTELDPS